PASPIFRAELPRIRTFLTPGLWAGAVAGAVFWGEARVEAGKEILRGSKSGPPRASRGGLRPRETWGVNGPGRQGRQGRQGHGGSWRRGTWERGVLGVTDVLVVLGVGRGVCPTSHHPPPAPQVAGTGEAPAPEESHPRWQDADHSPFLARGQRRLPELPLRSAPRP